MDKPKTYDDNVDTTTHKNNSALARLPTALQESWAFEDGTDGQLVIYLCNESFLQLGKHPYTVLADIDTVKLVPPSQMRCLQNDGRNFHDLFQYFWHVDTLELEGGRKYTDELDFLTLITTMFGRTKDGNPTTVVIQRK
jgi:hypothetical protein